MRGLGRIALGALLACALVPVPASMAAGDEVAGSADGGAGTTLVPGTYVEHEAIAYVIDSGIQAFSLGDDPLANAESLMSINAGTAAQALEGDTGAPEAAVAARALSLSDDAEAAGRLVLVRDEGATAEQLIAELEADPRVVFAESNAIVETGDGEDTPSDLGALAELAEEGASSPSVAVGQDKADPVADLDGFLWGFDNDGRMAGTTRTGAVDMGYADWGDAEAAKKLEEVVVADIDTGTDASNPDLAPVMWNKGLTSGIESTGKEDVHGFAVIGDGAGITSTTGLTGYHGTHTAGTIAAAWDDQGVSGLAGNVRIMSVRHDDTLSGMLECFDYISRARDAGVNVRVTNNSWGLGQGQWRSIDLAVTEIGRQGVVSVFAAGNSTYDNDTAGSTAGTLADNPYAVIVDAIDPTGSLALFTQYGKTTTDVMAPGTTILSTYATGLASGEGIEDGPQYLGEADEHAALYESFDTKSHVAAGINPTAFASFASTAGTCEVESDGKSFDGEGALGIPYDPSAPETSTGNNSAVSGVVDLSGLAEKPTHLSIRYTATVQGTTSILPLLGVSVMTTDKTTDDGWASLTSSEGPFGYGGDSWAGLSGRLPDNVDWEHFQVSIIYRIVEFSAVGGVDQAGDPVAGTLVVDSIGLGNHLAPYAYLQGTSMACPAVAGAAAVIAGQGLDDVAANGAEGSAKSAEKLAALVKGAAEPDTRYDGLCSTGGYATVDGAQNPGPAITEVVDNGNAVTVRGYFMPEGSTVVLGGTAATVSARADLGDGKAELAVQKPEGFAGGQTVVRVEAGGKHADHCADLGKRVDATYYDQTDLPVPDELSTWGAWQLVGFNGDVYCLPRTSLFDTSMLYDHLLRYDPDEGAWEEVPLPTSLDGIDLPGGIVDASGATLDGALVLQLIDADGMTYLIRCTAGGAWEALEFEFSNSEEGVPFASTLGSDGERLYLFGGLDAFGDSTSVYRADSKSYTFKEAGELSTGRMRPQVAYGNGAFVVAGGVSASIQLGGADGAELLKPQEEGLEREGGLLDTAAAEEDIPAGWLASTPIDFSPLVTETGQLAFATGAIEGGFTLVGPTSDDRTTDTYLLTAETTSAVSAYGKKSSQQALFAPAATAYRGRFYVLAGSQNEPYRVFSTTAMKTATQPGDAEIAPEPDPKPDPTPKPLPTPDPNAQTVVSDGGTPKALVRTGDRVETAPLLLAAFASAVAMTLAIPTIRRRRVHKS